MKSLARFLFIGVILAFVAGSVVHAVDTSGMSVGMASMTDGLTPDCDGCGGDADGGTAKTVCPDACMAQAIAILAAATAVPARISHATDSLLAGPIIGMAGPPDPYPPKPALT